MDADLGVKSVQSALSHDSRLQPDDLTAGGHSLNFDAPSSPYVSGFAEQADEIKKLQEELANLKEALKRERHRADLCHQQLQHLLGNCMQNRHCCDHEVPQQTQEEHARNGTSATEYVTITKQEYELLLLKDRAMDVLSEGITIADCSSPDMPLMYANAGFARTTGYSVKETVGKNCRFLQGEGTDRASLQELRDAINAEQSCVVQLWNYKKNGDPFINYLSVTPIHDNTGKLTHYVGIQSDITEMVNHKKAELAAKHVAIQAAAATEAKSQFLARMSHEIRTPLNGMIAVGQLLAETSLSPAQWDLVNTIRCSGETLLTLITDILDFSRIEANKMVLNMATFKLETVIEAAMEIAGLRAAQKRLQVAYNIASDTPRMLYGDAQRLQQILLNIVNNAVKFTEQGEVLLEVWCEFASSKGEAEPKDSQGTQSTAPDPDLPTCTVHFSVRDTGIGISQNDIVRLFHSFSQVDASPTRRYGGSGLGLAISKKLCEAMGGHMWVESSGLGLGSTFKWTISCKIPKLVTPRQRRGSFTPIFTPSRADGGSNLESPNFRLPPASEDDNSSMVSSDAGLVSCPSDRQADLLKLMIPASNAGRDNDSSLPLLRGKKILLLEPCDMVRQVLMLAIRSWGCFVCVVESETAAIQKLSSNLQTFPLSPISPSASATGHHSCMSLQHCGKIDESLFACPGPYDVVIMDMSCAKLLSALTQCDEREAQRLVFMGWPGQNELDTPHSSKSTEEKIQYDFDIMSGSKQHEVAARPSKALAEEMAKPQNRQLGYVVVTRPVRQGRLKLALEEVLMMQLDSGMYWLDDAEGPGSSSEGANPSHFLPNPTLNSLKPAQMKKSNSGGDLAIQATAQHATYRILLAEDNLINMKVALGILRRIGCTNVTTVENGEEALTALTLTDSGPDAFDLVLMDLHMPRMGGMDVVREVKKRYLCHHVRIVAVTADAFEDTRDHCLAAGFDGWLAKPFRVEDLTSIIADNLSGNRSRLSTLNRTSSSGMSAPTTLARTSNNSGVYGVARVSFSGTTPPLNRTSNSGVPTPSLPS